MGVAEIFSHKHADENACLNCGTPIKYGVTTQYLEEIDAEVCAVCEQPIRG